MPFSVTVAHLVRVSISIRVEGTLMTVRCGSVALVSVRLIKSLFQYVRDGAEDGLVVIRVLSQSSALF